MLFFATSQTTNGSKGRRHIGNLSQTVFEVLLSVIRVSAKTNAAATFAPSKLKGTKHEYQDYHGSRPVGRQRNNFCTKTNSKK